ncbi:MAG: hypothetical protein ACE5IF_00465 [Candidatus Bathyarchaeia archaeon]
MRIEEVNLRKLEGFLTEFNEPLSDVDVMAVRECVFTVLFNHVGGST